MTNLDSFSPTYLPSLTSHIPTPPHLPAHIPSSPIHPHSYRANQSAKTSTSPTNPHLYLTQQPANYSSFVSLGYSAIYPVSAMSVVRVWRRCVAVVVHWSGFAHAPGNHPSLLPPPHLPTRWRRRRLQSKHNNRPETTIATSLTTN